ncbi:oligoendopeptidase F [Alkalicoccus urumqiensis]|uniref:Oligopeptidase F n=1 Tax=Alkalicoccus urumqiensis TaxID=1548213 RepID=A0A2P6MID5_ALKUR|nr:oligoendopeptidase F [Alkalicoccus urumqiensis]PRO66065.1 oligoendopeptidase F [Alkalicoccus urumqiensis]
MTVRQRHEVAEAETWDLRDLFRTPSNWEAAVEEIPEILPEVTKWKGFVTESGQSLRAALTAREAVMVRLQRITHYAMLGEAGDAADPENQERAARASSLAASVHAELQFIDNEIMTLDEDTLDEFLLEDRQLRTFERYLRHQMQKRAYQLPDAAEAVFAGMGEVLDAPYGIYERSRTSDLVFPDIPLETGGTHPLTYNSFPEVEASQDTAFRRTGTDVFYGALGGYESTYAAVYQTEVRRQVLEARMRGYDSVTEMLLMPQQVTPELYHRQLDTIFTELAPHMRRFARLKKEVLGLEAMTFADLKAPLDPDYAPKMSFEEASRTIVEALRPLGPDYGALMERAVSERWVDYADNAGKRSGAFCANPYGVHPYLLLTWHQSMQDAFTLAHELGHAGHFALASEHQRAANVQSSLYFIEAPSTLNELLLSRYLLDHAEDERMKRWVLLQSLGTYYHNFVTHLLEGEFQRRVYALAEKDTPLTAVRLNEVKLTVLREFWGDEVEIPDYAGRTWMRQPHYYMGLYPYTYSAGLSISTAVMKRMQEDPDTAEQWLEVLKTGGSKTPLELVEDAGLDMAAGTPIQEAVDYVGSVIEQLEHAFTGKDE